MMIIWHLSARTGTTAFRPAPYTDLAIFGLLGASSRKPQRIWFLDAGGSKSSERRESIKYEASSSITFTRAPATRATLWKTGCRSWRHHLQGHALCLSG